MLNDKYKDLTNYLPSIENIINKNILSNDKIKCLENIYQFYSSNKDTSALTQKKSELRKIFKTKRKQIQKNTLKKWSKELSIKLINSEEYKRSNTVFCYISFNNEIDTFLILEQSLKDNKQLSVPVIKENKMIASRISSLTDLKKNKYGILEPSDHEEISKNKIDLIITPALLYNPLGYRLGYGEGYYDDFLKDYRGTSIGLIFKDYLIVDLIPTLNDVPVSKIIIQ